VREFAMAMEVLVDLVGGYGFCNAGMLFIGREYCGSSPNRLLDAMLRVVRGVV
jgi:hypothetical protein